MDSNYGMKAYTCIFSQNGNPSNQNSQSKQVSVIPVLPNLVTSTDEMTIFCTPNKIYDKERVYIIAPLTKVKNESIDNGKINNYSTNEAGDPQKFTKFICKHNPDIQIDSQENNQTNIDFSSVLTHLTEAILQMNINSVLNSKLKAFVRV